MGWTLLSVVVFVFDLFAFALIVAAKQRRASWITARLLEVIQDDIPSHSLFKTSNAEGDPSKSVAIKDVIKYLLLRNAINEFTEMLL
ncbi:hypothetical protein L6452_18898 [Arctium lappa]|uniref:Uncharacterized protein n=1 Tax=Arctium lappa TaxID=4217 RepID=A0ACB9B6J2_ARCLA|nr:hypothetical protein L6452_18898 [Arctium lappa]